MQIQFLCAGVLAFVIVAGFGSQYIQWLKKKDATQPLNETVEEKVYSKKSEDSPGEQA